MRKQSLCHKKFEAVSFLKEQKGFIVEISNIANTPKKKLGAKVLSQSLAQFAHLESSGKFKMNSKRSKNTFVFCTTLVDL